MTVHEANQQLAADLRKVIRDAEELLQATAGEAGGKVKELRDRLRAALDSAKTTCDRFQDQALETAKAADRVVRGYPYESIGIAFGLGLLIGVLVGRR